MRYSNEFKTKCFRVFRWSGRVTEIVKALEDENHNKVRILLEWITEDPKLFLDKVDREGRPLINPDKKLTYIDRNKLYSEFMEMYVKYLDKDAEVLVN